MCSAVRRRMLVKGTTSSRGAGADPVGRGHGRRGRRGGGAADGACGAGRWPAMLGTVAGGVAPSMTASTSARVMRPSSPVPRMVAGSRSCSARSLRTTGESTRAWSAPGGGDGSRASVGWRPAAPVAAVRPRRAPARRAATTVTPAPVPPAVPGGRRRGGGARRCGDRRRAQARAAGGGAATGAAAATGAGVAAAREPSTRAAGVAVDDGQGDADVDGVPLLDQDRREDPGGGRGHLGVDLVGRHLEQGLVAGDGVADRLEPLGDGPLGHRLAELRHGHVRQRGAPFRSGPAPSRRRSRTATGAVG